MKLKFSDAFNMGKMGNIKKHREYCFAQRNNSNVQNNTPEALSNAFTMCF